MARFDYFGLQQDIKTILEADAGVIAHWADRAPRILIERDLIYGMDEMPCVIIFFDRRDAPANMQGLSAGQNTRLRLRLSIWCLDFDFGDVAQACKNRDDLMGLVEVALMNNRQLGGKVGTSWIDGGEFMNSEGDKGFVSGGEIVLIADGVASTT